jgi:hypothetical protein
LRPGAKWRDYLFEWQQALVEGLNLRVFDAAPQTCDLVERLTKKRPSPEEVSERLRWASTYIDDEHWTQRQERDLGLEHVHLTNASVSRRFGVTMKVSGNGASLDDARLVSLIRQALAYRRTDGAMVELDDGTRLSVKLGEPVWARVGDRTLRTPDTVDLDDLAELERRGITFAHLLRSTQQLAS